MSKISDLFCAFCIVLFAGHDKSKISDIISDIFYLFFSCFLVRLGAQFVGHNKSEISSI